MLSLKIRAVILSLTSSVAIAAPVEDVTPNHLAKRAAGTQNDPHQLVISIQGWEDLAEINCYIVLCILGTSVFQRGPNQQYAQDQYTEGGAANQPFHDDGLQRYGTTRASNNAISPEDFPWRSVQLQPGQHRYLTGGPQGQQSVQGGCVNNAFQGHYGGDIVGYNQWFEIRLRPEDQAAGRIGPMCQAWLAEDTSVCGSNRILNILGVTGVVLAQLIYYYVGGRYLHATQKGGKRSIDSVTWDIDPDTLAWPEIPVGAHEVKRAIVVLDEAGNEITRKERRTGTVVELDEAGNVLSKDKAKRETVQLDGDGNVLSKDELKRETVQLDGDGNVLSKDKVKRETVQLEGDGNVLLTV